MKVITCQIFASDFKHFLPPEVEMRVLDIALHVSPERLRDKLQECVDEMEDGCKHIILGYGLCSCAVEGVVSQKASLVLPRMDDCTGVMLGSKAEYLRQQQDEPGTYYLSQGWMEAGTHLFAEYEGMVKRFGEERARRLMHSMIHHYSRLAYIDSDYAPTPQEYQDYCEETAANFNLRLARLPGSSRLIQKIIARQWDEDFLVFGPGKPIDRWRFFDDQDGKSLQAAEG
ncbi:MAG: DUF1638 domain-containing protein [Desulfarculaceae bacterium]|nr:DUF1638 domain-containing protein [Desulfarculaceae bacterium]